MLARLFSYAQDGEKNSKFNFLKNFVFPLDKGALREYNNTILFYAQRVIRKIVNMKPAGDSKKCSLFADRRSKTLRCLQKRGLSADKALKKPVRSGAEGAKPCICTVNLSGKRTESLYLLSASVILDFFADSSYFVFLLEVLLFTGITSIFILFIYTKGKDYG